MYQILKTSPGQYQFLTDYGIVYVVEFSDASGYFETSCALCALIENINFSQIGPSHVKIGDDKIGPTVSEIIKMQCRANDGAVLFVCDPSDKRELCRSKLFDTWDKRYNNGQFHFIRAVITHPSGSLHIGLIVEAINPQANNFIDEFTNSMQSIELKLN